MKVISPEISEELTKQNNVFPATVTPQVSKLNYAAALKKSSVNNFMASVEPKPPPARCKRKVPQKGIA